VSAMYDVIVVLGSGIKPDGTLPPISMRRVEKAVELFNNNESERMLMSGRWGFTLSFIPPRTEASAMKEYATSLGVKPGCVLCEEESKDTITNLFFVRKLFLEPMGWKKIIIVSSEYHLPRIEYLTRKIFGKEFEVRFEPADSKLSPEELIEKQKGEKSKLRFSKLILWNVKSGNLAAFEKKIRKDHPGYSKRPSLFMRVLMGKLQQKPDFKQ
jgi:uncharacterized SAM-binding protein YcdF (DUF218 family)